ncbi:MAG: hypothetical protein DRJ51_01835 [Thermoprotei archaeon]|nr:MAG: hypothetical protein DRJ36_04195 [Thermoprotei archaeon]RLE82285.1 MAG: hypothetical protein DRJ51_01835 [Thermoprotei archaeon]
MPRKSLASKFLVHIANDLDKDRYLVVYDFQVRGGGIPPRFYKNLAEIVEKTGRVLRVQKSVVECRGFKTAEAVAFLAQHYGARVVVYKVFKRIR